MTHLTGATALTEATLRAGAWFANAAPSPSPSPSGFGVFMGDEDLVTPGVVGFIVTFLVALTTVFLIVDMTRRVRRTRYRGEVRERLEAEAAAAAAGQPARADGDPAFPDGDATSPDGTPDAGPDRR
jgi:hypothetical protein